MCLICNTFSSLFSAWACSTLACLKDKDRKLMARAIIGVIIETPENLCSLIFYPPKSKQAEAPHQSGLGFLLMKQTTFPTTYL